MKRLIWAQPDKHWEGFRFCAYFLNSDKIWTLPITRESVKSGNNAKVSTTVGEAYADLVKRRLEFERDSGLHFEVTADDEKLEFSGTSFHCDILREMLALKQDGVEPLSARWFWYDKDSCMQDPMESYSFFVVHADKIVREHVLFCDYHGNGFDPDVFESRDNTDEIWRNTSYWNEASDTLWYRRFYTETDQGRLMVLRPDEPLLYRYERAPIGNMEKISQRQSVTLLRAYKLLLVILPLLVSIAFPSIRTPMAAVAGALGLDFLWVCWATREK